MPSFGVSQQGLLLIWKWQGYYNLFLVDLPHMSIFRIYQPRKVVKVSRRPAMVYLNIEILSNLFM